MATIKEKVTAVSAYNVDYVGIDLFLDGFAVEAVSGDPATFAAAVKAVNETSKKPLILIANSAELAKAGLEAAEGAREPRGNQGDGC